MAVYTGEKPRRGTYKCEKCGRFLRLYKNTDRLPSCKFCHNNKFKKLVWPSLLYNLITGHEDMSREARKKAKLKAQEENIIAYIKQKKPAYNARFLLLLYICLMTLNIIVHF